MSLFRFTLSLALLLPLAGRAQGADGGVPDAGILYDLPDASVDTGGADRDNQEGEDGLGPGGTCISSRDCATRFGCVQGQCRYSGIRQAERVGCLLGPEGTLAVMGLALIVGGRRRKKEGR